MCHKNPEKSHRIVTTAPISDFAVEIGELLY